MSVLIKKKRTVGEEEKKRRQRGLMVNQKTDSQDERLASAEREDDLKKAGALGWNQRGISLRRSPTSFTPPH